METGKTIAVRVLVSGIFFAQPFHVGDHSARLKNGNRFLRLPFFHLCSMSPPFPHRTRWRWASMGPPYLSKKDACPKSPGASGVFFVFQGPKNTRLFRRYQTSVFSIIQDLNLRLPRCFPACPAAFPVKPSTREGYFFPGKEKRTYEKNTENRPLCLASRSIQRTRSR